MFKKKANEEINIGSQPEQEEKEPVSKKKIKREDLIPEPEPTLELEPKPIVIPRTVPLPFKPLPIVVPEPEVITDIYTKYGGWIFKNNKVFVKETLWPFTGEAKSGIVPEKKKPYFDDRSMSSFSRQIKKNR